MDKSQVKTARRNKVRARIRRRVRGTAELPRLAVFKSNRYIYAQAIDDDSGTTLASASTFEKGVRGDLANSGGVNAAKVVGETIAERVREKGIQSVVFDRGGYRYHGKIKALADAAREGGLKF